MNCSSTIHWVIRGILSTTSLTVTLSAAAQSGAPLVESVQVKNISEPSPQWLVDAVKGDNFTEPVNSPTIASTPYSTFAADSPATTGTVYHQPSGSLTGKTMFVMAGHGWTYDADKMHFYTQRGLSQGMVEDMGNADQMHIFAHLVFNSGANVFPFRPIDHQPNERVLDNTMSQVKFYGNWRAGSANEYFGETDSPERYAVTSASLVESAVARYQPYIPETGYYPVYVWARDGADRTNQLYRVNHAGGQAEIQVNWRRAGKSWAWLGTYYFEKGWAGYVDISNRVNDPYEADRGGITVADAVRFGNGKGDVPRPSGASGFNKEDEGDCYWIQRGLGATADYRIYDIGADGNSTVSSPPKAAAYANRETEGSFFDRLLISFHSNASTGKARGAIGLYNASIGQRPTYQESLAQFTGEEINRQMLAMPAPTDVKWLERERHTYNGINFGELRRDYLQNELCATIIETAFHDNAEDVSFLLDPMARIGMAEASLRGVIKWYASTALENTPVTMPPSRPKAIYAQVTDDNKVQVRFKIGNINEFEGDEPKSVRVYRSSNGYGFDGGYEFSLNKDNTVEIDPITTTGVTFIRMSCSNQAGESLPSQTISVGIASDSGNSRKRKTLLVSRNIMLDRSANAEYKLGAQVGGPYKPEARTDRVRAIYAMNEPTGAAEALAMAACNLSFDGSDSNAVNDEMVKPSQYQRIFIAAGLEGKFKSALSSELINALTNLVEKGGKVLYSGYYFAGESDKAKASERRFESDILGISEITTTSIGSVFTSADVKFMPTTFTLQLAKTPRFWDEQQALFPKLLEGKKGRSLTLMESGNSKQAAAILTRPFASEGEIITLAFPLSMVTSPADRNAIMAAIDKQL